MRPKSDGDRYFMRLAFNSDFPQQQNAYDVLQTKGRKKTVYISTAISLFEALLQASHTPDDPEQFFAEMSEQASIVSEALDAYRAIRALFPQAQAYQQFMQYLTQAAISSRIAASFESPPPERANGASSYVVSYQPVESVERPQPVVKKKKTGSKPQEEKRRQPSKKTAAPSLKKLSPDDLMSPVDEYASETYDEPYVAMPTRNNSTVPQVTKVTPAQMLAYQTIDAQLKNNNVEWSPEVAERLRSNSKALNQGFDDDDDFDDIE